MTTTTDVIELAHEAQGATGLFDSLLSSLREHFHCDVAMLHVAASFPVTVRRFRRWGSIDRE